VWNHKTASCHGYAKIIIDRSLYDAIGIYRSVLRPQAKNFDPSIMDMPEYPLFITNNSTPMHNGYVSIAIASSWKRAKIDKKFFCVTNFRKSVVNIVHTECPDLRGNLASQMSHHLSTAEKFYKNVCQSNIEAIKTVDSVRNCLKLSGKKQIVNAVAETSSENTELNVVQHESPAKLTNLHDTFVYTQNNSSIHELSQNFKRDATTQTDFNCKCSAITVVSNRTNNDNLSMLRSVQDKPQSANVQVKRTLTTLPSQPVKKSRTTEQTLAHHGRRSFEKEHVTRICNNSVIKHMIEIKCVDSEKLRDLLNTDQNMHDIASLYTVKQIRDRIRCVYRK
jgi:hypothetical protein